MSKVGVLSGAFEQHTTSHSGAFQNNEEIPCETTVGAPTIMASHSEVYQRSEVELEKNEDTRQLGASRLACTHQQREPSVLFPLYRQNHDGLQVTRG